MASDSTAKSIVKRLPNQTIFFLYTAESTAKLIVKRLPNKTIFFLDVVRRCSKINREASSKSNFILPIGRQKV